MLTIAVDAMGGDYAPKSEVEGAVRAASEYPVRVILVGPEDIVRRELQNHPDADGLPIEVHHASEFITMEDSAAKAVRTKKDSSIKVASRLMRDGDARGVVSAGNTGAVMATAKITQGMIRGVTRPALASAFPTVKGTPVVVLDVGANVDSRPEMLAQFAVMGEVYSRIIFHNRRPRVGLLSIGEEEHKGNDLTRAAQPLIKALPINFIGNVEGRDVFTGDADVIVCDGFIGNVTLKVSEGLVELITGMLRESLEATVRRKLGAVLSRDAFRELKKRVDYSEYGGAPLLGVKGVNIICHGRSNANAIKNAIRVAAEFAQGRVNEKIEDELEQSAASKAVAT
ncbi:MAG: phosphate acyltransferase PlsX [Bryobacterales bacterium]|nr:phosphate acyltransferase PlsX [Bryobacterales bacterium]